ncbi:hypothetical protein DBV15_12974 [Temnothorax longispinosus]|uniref:Uncharacterized protein n=1 Tax=Temnothorax longispinosus TaxID=300112 RepID=A0A4S2LCB6_9HYME|nr:hypothetical protein DBV15_12974 [Temnothorax longispinosus]
MAIFFTRLSIVFNGKLVIGRSMSKEKDNLKNTEHDPPTERRKRNLVLALESTLSLISVAITKQLIGGARVPSRIALSRQRSAVYHQYASDLSPETDIIGKVRELAKPPVTYWRQQGCR